MYHYIRPTSGQGLDNFKYLRLSDFCHQLDYFQANFNLISLASFQAILAGSLPIPSNAMVLTFDDGISDHYKYVFPELRKRGLWGCFYVPTMPFQHSKMLDVHRIHLLLGRWGGSYMMEELRKIMDETMIPDERREDFRQLTYVNQQNTNEETLFKRTLNYYISYKHRGSILNELVKKCLPDEAAILPKFYINKAEIREMQESGMLIGSHSISHPVFSKLEESEQRAEILDSFQCLDEIVGGLKMRTFCYPYGGFHTFTKQTEEILDEAKCSFSFNVESRDINLSDLEERPQALPRFDCNEFPNGKASTGP